MVRSVLLLVDRDSIQKQLAFPNNLARLMESDGTVTIETACYDELIFTMSTGACSIQIANTSRDIASFDAVYLRRIGECSSHAEAVGVYCRHKEVMVADAEVADRPGSRSKLNQYMRLGLAGMPIPYTIFSVDHQVLVEAVQKDQILNFPMIIKARSGTRGSDNYLIDDKDSLTKVLTDFPGIEFMAQEYIPNTCDYRVWVCGRDIGPVMKRIRHTGHKNNTSQGGTGVLVPHDEFPSHVLDACVKAAQLLRRDIAGVDVVFPNDTIGQKFYFFEINRSPQVENTAYAVEKASALAKYFVDYQVIASSIERPTIGCLEEVAIAVAPLHTVWAKVDTGAYSGAMHCTKIVVVRRGKDKRRILKFVPYGKAKYATETSDFMETYIRSATGHRIKRYIIDTMITLDGHQYPIRIGLADRGRMKYPVLLGRRFLRENNITVDVHINEIYDDEGENTR